MALTRLPTELLEAIITHVFPEGFESVADPRDLSPTIATAGDLIRRIAVEPVLARYVQFADFKLDSSRSPIISRGFVGDADCPEDVIRLFANSPYLEQAGLDWKEFLDRIEEELNAEIVPRYSQHAAAFLLTLLPNVERLILPRYWKPLDATDKLIDAVVHKANQSHSLSDRPSLAQLTRLEPYVSLALQDPVDLGWAKPFLAKPRIRSFRGPSCVIMDDNYKRIMPRDPHYGFGETLESVSFVACCVDEVGIADFLENTKRLKTLRYSHSTRFNGSSRCWDICKFIEAIERQVGSHLVELSVSIGQPSSWLGSGEVSMRGFACLRQLEFPLEIVMWNITIAAFWVTLNESLVGGSSDHELDCGALFLGDLVPASVSVLSLISHGKYHHENALNVMFRDFAARKETTLPALKEIHLTCPNGADDAYKDRCTRLLAETEKARVVLHLEPWPHSGALTWDGEL